MEPDELRYKEFKRSVRGYSPDEVDDLLDSVANELENLRAEQVRLTTELDETRARIEQYESLEGSIRSTLIQAEKAASDYQETARRDAEVVIHEAEARARRMLADTSSKVQRIQESYEALRETRDGFDSELRRLLEGYLRQLDEANSSIARELEAPLQERLDTEAISAAHAAAEEERQEQNVEENGPMNRENREDAKETAEQEPDDEPSSGETVETTEPIENAEEPDSHQMEPSGKGAENSGRGRFLRRRG